MSPSLSIAIWAVVLVFAVVAVFIIRFLNQLTKVGKESETALKTLNTKLPPLLDRADNLMDKADAAILRVNATMEEIEPAIHLVKIAGQLVSSVRIKNSANLGKWIMPIFAGIKTGKAIIDSIRRHRSSNCPKDGNGD